MINLPSFIFSLIMGGLMSLSITFATTFVRIGVAGNFFWVWFEVWLVAYPVAVICILLYRPFVSHLTAKLVEKLK
jgi:multisubunit Na+/H+ antiporter MnhG subunit